MGAEDREFLANTTPESYRVQELFAKIQSLLLLVVVTGAVVLITTVAAGGPGECFQWLAVLKHELNE